jgi:Skp family chaperone for outer membrane proteins
MLFALSLAACGSDANDALKDYETLVVQAEELAKQDSVTQAEYMDFANQAAEVGKTFQEKASSFSESDAKRFNELSGRLMTAMQTVATKIAE